MRNKVASMLQFTKQKCFDSLSTADNKQFWKTIKFLNKQHVSIPTLNQDGVSANTDKEKSNMLNEYFSKCWNHSELSLSKLSAVDHMENNFSFDDLLCFTDEIVQFIQG